MSTFLINEPLVRKQKIQIFFTNQSNIYKKSRYFKTFLSKEASLSRGKNLTKRYGYNTDSFYAYKNKPTYFKRGNNFFLGDII